MVRHQHMIPGVALAMGVFFGFGGHAHAGKTPAALPEPTQAQVAAMKSMVDAAKGFLASLDEAGKVKAAFDFDAEQRTSWHYVPMPRAGLPLKAMTPAQREAAAGLLKTGLSAPGLLKVNEIISLEMVLREIEGKAGDARAATRRDPELYYHAVYGEPSMDKPWGWRIEGHHISLHFTMIDGRVVATTPAFLGANPHETRQGPKAGARPLGAEEDLARALLATLDDEARARAVLNEEVPGDIFTANKRKVEFEGPAKGLRAGDMSPESRAALDRLINEYIALLDDDLAAMRRAKIDALTPAQRDDIHFAWIGAAEKGRPHYYRVQAPTFLIEYDNVQNEANHSHVVWRDYDGDFGLDFLAVHHARDPH